MKYEYYVDIDKGISDKITFFKYDTDLDIFFHFYKDGSPVDLTNTQVRMFMNMPSGLKVFDDIIVVDSTKGLCKVNNTENMFSEAGSIYCDFTLFNGVLTKSVPKFLITIKEPFRNDRAITSSDEFTALVNALNTVNENNSLIQELNKKVQNIGSGSPQGVYDTLAELKVDYPLGASGTFLVGDNWVYWDVEASDWKVGGVYQSIILNEETIEQKITDIRNIINEMNTNTTEKVGILDDKIDEANLVLENMRQTISICNTVSELILTDFSEGKTVIMLGYYANNDGATHLRTIDSTDKGFGIQLSNGLYANLVYSNVINLKNIGARRSDKGAIYDIKPYIDKVVNLGLDNTVQMQLDAGYYGISENNYDVHGFQLVSSYKYQYYTSSDVKGNSKVVLFPIGDDQTATLSIGNTKKRRGLFLSGLQITSNKYYYNDSNEFVASDTEGSRTSLDVKFQEYGGTENLIISGTNSNVEYGYKFNGCEIAIDNIMFRGLGLLGGNFKCAFYTYITTLSDNTSFGPSGMIIRNLGFEGVGGTWIKAAGVEVQYVGISGEIGSVKTANNYVTTSYLNIPTDESGNLQYTSLGLIDVDQTCYGIQFTNIAVQKLGQTWTDGTNYISQDQIIRYVGRYTAFAYYVASNIFLQQMLKPCYGTNFLYKESNVNESGDYGNKPVYKIVNINSDNYPISYYVKDNAAMVRETNRNVQKKSNGMAELGNTVVRFTNNILYPCDSALQHSVMWSNTYQKEFIGYIKAYTGYENIIAIFNMNEALNKGTHYLFINHASIKANAVIQVTFTYMNDIVETYNITLPKNSAYYEKTTAFKFAQTTVKFIKKITLTHIIDSEAEVQPTDLRIYSIQHKYDPVIDEFNLIE